MSKHFKTIFILLGIFFSMSVTSWAEASAPKEIDVVMDNNYPPFVFYDADHQLKGILIDEWALFQKKTGIKINIHAMDWSAALEGMEKGEYDVIDTIFKNPEREELYAFTEPYADIEVSVFFHKNISGINTLESLKGFSVAAKRGDQAVNVLLDAGIENITLYNSYEEIVKAASNNEVVIFAIDNPPARYFLYKYGLQDTFNHTAPLYTGQFHRAVPKENASLINTLEAGFAMITPVEEQEIQDKWYGKSNFFNETITKYFKLTITVIVLVILGLLAWNTTLRHSVHKKTADLSEAIHKLSYNESKLHAIIESMPDWVFVISKDGMIIDFLTPNKVSSLLAPPEEFIGHSLYIFLNPLFQIDSKRPSMMFLKKDMPILSCTLFS